MIPIVTPAEMAAIDAAAARAGGRADRARPAPRSPGAPCSMLGGGYGRVVT